MLIDLGCSFYKRANHLGVDIILVPGVDVVADACNLPFKDSTIEGIFSSHCIEHIENQLGLIRELYRVSKHNAILHIIAPHFSNPAYFDDITHKQKYSSRSFEHFDHELHSLTGYTNYLPDVNFKLFSKRLNYWPERNIVRKSKIKVIIIRFITNIFNWAANKNLFLCERLWCYWVGGFYEVEFKLRVIKSSKLHMEESSQH